MAKTEKTNALTYTKEQLCDSVKYSKFKDVLSSQLKDDGVYTFEAVDAIIEKFMKGKVN